LPEAFWRIRNFRSKEVLQQKLTDWVREQEVAYGAGNVLR